ncbi:MAG: NAD(P)/FAD-dependent oxidoreductase [Clostridiales bacterium]|nr:NAD(P)/FAD-dependent oxidoreductase [Clostridiales bacterium]
MSRVIVVGGGAAGMIAAISAAMQGHDVLLLEQNEKLGKKLFITGKGRCNVTNACEADKFFENVVTNPKFLYSAFYGFDNMSLMSMLEEAGCRLKIERGERVFPVSDHSSDVIAALSRILKKNGVEVRLNTKVISLLTEENAQDSVKRVCGVILDRSVKADGKKAGLKKANSEKVNSNKADSEEADIEKADAVIIATGGLSYSSTGSTGDGLRIAQALGHKIKDCVPSLVPLTVSEDWCMRLQGLSLKNVNLLMRDGNKEVYNGFGEMLFTHFGVSGPLVLSASSLYNRCKNKDNVTCELDLKPALSEEQLEMRLLRDFEENQNKQFKNALGGLLPAKLIPIIIELSNIMPDKKVNEITREERKGLVNLLKHLVFHVSGVRGFDEAVITQGGINVKEINPSTMESKLVKNLYFAGEILDVDALTGGFNLQIAWSTGHLAGKSIEEKNHGI